MKTLLTLLILTLLPVSPRAQTLCVWEIDSVWADAGVMIPCHGKWISAAWCIDTIPHWIMWDSLIYDVAESHNSWWGKFYPIPRVDTVYIHDTVYVTRMVRISDVERWMDSVAAVSPFFSKRVDTIYVDTCKQRSVKK